MLRLQQCFPCLLLLSRNPLFRSVFALLEGFSITEGEVTDLIAFLETLTDETFINDPRFGNPFEGNAK